MSHGGLEVQSSQSWLKQREWNTPISLFCLPSSLPPGLDIVSWAQLAARWDKSLEMQASGTSPFCNIEQSRGRPGNGCKCKQAQDGFYISLGRKKKKSNYFFFIYIPYSGLQGDQTSQSWRKSVLNIHWKDRCWSWSSNTLTTWCEELTH